MSRLVELLDRCFIAVPRRAAKDVRRARLIPQARRSPERLSPRPREPCHSVDLGARAPTKAPGMRTTPSWRP